MKVLVTGGAGYIGSHTVLALVEAGHDVVLVDNFSNSHPEVLPRLEKLAGRELPFVKADLCDATAVEAIFSQHSFDAVIHFAGFKAVGESVAKPLMYYQNNLVSTLNLLQAMQAHGVYRLVFSSSCTVYGDPAEVPVTETSALQATNPYGRTKLILEDVMRDLVVGEPKFQISLLRYFNPIGAHESGQIGEDPNGIPNCLLPYVAQVAVGRLERVRVFGGDYDTLDGTGVRDYIHVTDVAAGHVAALDHLPQAGQCEAINLGTGQGKSVLEVIKAFEQACGKPIPYDVVDRRPGDVATTYADPRKAKQELDWEAKKTLEDACADIWRWQSGNPNGYTA